MPYTVYNSVSDLISGTEPNRSEGRIWRGGQMLLREAPSSATDHHVTTTGGVKLYAADDTSDACIVGAPDAADPSQRASFAPALVTSMQSRRLRGVTLRELLGRSYDPGHDAAATLNAFIPELAPAGVVIRDPDNLELRCAEPVRIESDLKMHLGPNTTFKRYFTGAGEAASLFAPADWGTDVDRFELINGVLTAGDSAQTGKMMSIWGERWKITGTKFLDWFNGQALIHGGKDGRITDVLFYATQQLDGTGPCRMVGGTGFRGTNIHAYGGDDLFQFVPITNSNNPRFNESIEDSYYIGCHGRSWNARVAIAAIAGPQNENIMSAHIRDCGFIGVSGYGGNRCLTIFEEEGDGNVARQIDNITVDNCHFDGSNQGEETDQDALISGSFQNAIGSVKITNTTIGRKTPRAYGLWIDAPGGRVALDNVTLQGEVSALHMTSESTLVLRGGEFRVQANGGGHTASNILSLGASSGAARLHVESLPMFEGIPTGAGAIRISSGTARAWIGDIEANKETTATGTKAVSHAAGATLKLGEVYGTADADESGGGTLARLP